MKKTNQWKIPLFKINVTKSDINSVTNVIKRGTDWACGQEINQLENKLSNYIGTKYCLVFNSGTSAGHAVLHALNIKHKHVIVPSLSFIATANWPLMVGAKPQFCDIENETLGMDPSKLQQKITKNTKVIMPIHYAGLPCKINEIKKIAAENHIPLIEDAAESIGASIKNKKVGTFGDASIFSFAANKVLTSGEGGAVVTNSKSLFEKLKLIRSHGRSIKENYFASIQNPNYVSLGFNWRMSSITAALALSQLNRLDSLIKMRQKNAKYLIKKLQKFKEITFHSTPEDYIHVYQLFTIMLPNAKIRNELSNFLTKKGIMSKVFFVAIHQTNFYKKLKSNYGDLSTTENICDRMLSLPMYPDLKETEMDLISMSIEEFFSSRRK
tara:strand:- start:871 stop:2019 length:1149 start_codon:yes stop_codon:yes gene_type:complete